MKSSFFRASGEESPQWRQCSSPAQALVPWALLCSARQGGVFLSMSAPSGSENPSGFPISPFSSDGLTVGNSSVGGGGLVCKERAILWAAEQVPGVGHLVWQQRCCRVVLPFGVTDQQHGLGPKTCSLSTLQMLLLCWQHTLICSSPTWLQTIGWKPPCRISVLQRGAPLISG